MIGGTHANHLKACQVLNLVRVLLIVSTRSGPLFADNHRNSFNLTSFQIECDKWRQMENVIGGVASTKTKTDQNSNGRSD